VGRVLVVACILIAASSAAARAEEPPLVPDVVDTVDVVAERPDPAEVVPTFATVHDVSRGVESISTVADVIESGAGVHVRRYGGLGAYAAASIRASAPGQVEVYLDGIPIQSAQWGVTNLADLPLEGLERIEVYRGGAPSGFGTPGIGGVINLVTRPPGRGRSLASVSTGSHDTWKVDLLRAGAVRSIGYLASYHHLQSGGDFEYLDRHGTPENPDDDAIVTRENNAFRQSDGLLKLTLPPIGGWRVELADELFRKESGVPGIENVHIESVHFEILRNIAFATIEPPPLAGGAVAFRAKAFHQYRRDLFFNPDDEVGFSRSDTDNRSAAYGANLEAVIRSFGNRQTLRFFGEVRRERFTPEDKNPSIGVGFTRRRRSSTISAEERLVLLGDRLEVVAAYRYQEAVDNYSGPVPFGAPPAPRDDPHWAVFHGPILGLRWWLAPTVTVKANRTRYARFPTMMELFGASGYVEANPELESEVGTTTDAGVVIRTGDGSGLLEAALFWADREDLITFLQNSQRTVKAFNLESARVEGVELTARRAWPNGLSLASSYTLQYARNEGPSPVYNGKRLPYEPVHDLYVRTGYDAGRLGVWHEYHFEGESYRDRANLPENLTRSSHVHNVGVRCQVVRGLLTATLQIQNLADERFVDVEGYPLPGRTFFLTLAFEHQNHEGGDR
jgi:iron complex outermembrane receptor protein